MRVNLPVFGRNLLFALILLMIVGSISYADLPLTQRVEEYIAFVLTTDFDYEAWIASAGGQDFLARMSAWRDRVPWLGDDGATEVAPVGPAAPTR